MRFFVDTNVLVYADDRDAPEKRARAREIIRSAFRQRTGAVSHQVLRELFVAATRKLDLSAVAARRRVELYARLDVVSLSLTDLLAAIDLTRLHSLSLWDALIFRAALIGGCQVLYSEDLQDGFRLEGLEVVNPFRSRPAGGAGLETRESPKV